jgi:tetratricopeptide (TPR) repeat protein
MSERAIFTGLLAGYAFHNIFVFDNLMSYVMFMIIFSYITMRSVPDKEWGTALPESSAQVAVPVVVAAVCVMLYFVNVPGYAAASGVIQGLSPQPAGVTKNLEYFKNASAGSGLGLQEVGEQFIQFAIQARSVNAGDQKFQMEVATGARDTFLRVLEQAPTDARLLVFYGTFLRQFGDVNGAREYLSKAEVVSPLKQSILIERGVLEYGDGKYDVALVYFKKVYDTAPQFGRVHILYASAAILAGQNQLADELMVRHFGTTEPDDTTIIQAYVGAKNYAKATKMATARVTADPTSLDKRKFLAGMYLQMGNTQGAIGALQDAIVASPEFKAEGESYISQIKAGTLK